MSEAIHWTNETRRLDELQPWPRNPRQINKDQAKRLAQSFDEFGQVETIAIGPGNEVYNGHQRLNVLMDKHGGAYEVEVRVSSRPLSEKEREKLTVFLHKGAAGEWDWDALANEFEFADLVDWGFDEKELLGAGFEQDDPKGEDPGAQVDRAEELRVKWAVESGQLWKLGEHRLICGDCTDRAVVEKVMGGEKADCVIADAPYGMDLDTQYKKGDSRLYNGAGDHNRKNYPAVIGDDRDFDPRPVMSLFGCQEQYWFGADYYAERIPEKNNGSWLVWDKRAGIEDIKFTLSEFELIWSKTKKARSILRVKWFGIHGMEKQDTSKRVHPTQKPLELIEKIIALFDGGIIVDPYAGSGTTIIACENLKRKCRAVEISPAYCAVAIQRWVDMTGGVPELIS